MRLEDAVMPTPASCERQVRLVRASNDEELRAAAAFRSQMYFERRRLPLDEVTERRRDRIGHVFLLLNCAGQPVATGRVSAYPAASSELTRLRPVFASPDADSEVDRIAAIRSPDGLRHSLQLLVLGSAWLLQNTSFRRYVACCHPKLLDLYRLVGAHVVAGPGRLPGRPGPYQVIGGRHADAAALGHVRACPGLHGRS